jgi:hypothetical protein
MQAPKYYVQNRVSIECEMPVECTQKIVLAKVRVYLIHCFEQGPNHLEFKQTLTKFEG